MFKSAFGSFTAKIHTATLSLYQETTQDPKVDGSRSQQRSVTDHPLLWLRWHTVKQVFWELSYAWREELPNSDHFLNSRLSGLLSFPDSNPCFFRFLGPWYGGCKTYGGRKTYQRTRSPENFGPLQKSFRSALSWIFVQEKQSTGTWEGWKTYRTRVVQFFPPTHGVLWFSFFALIYYRRNNAYLLEISCEFPQENKVFRRPMP